MTWPHRFDANGKRIQDDPKPKEKEKEKAVDKKPPVKPKTKEK
jgi:hypothetical protein